MYEYWHWLTGPMEKELKIIRVMLALCGYTPTPVTADLCGQEVFIQGAPTSALVFSLSASFGYFRPLWFLLPLLHQATFVFSHFRLPVK